MVKVKQEQGRSMVEMLGVLAIVGVLSVMGIAGYTAAMRAHKANEIVNATSMCYMLGMAANAGTGGQELVYTPKPDGVTSITFQNTNKIEIAGIAGATLCAQVKAKFGDDKVTGDCTSPYTLIVTLGEDNGGTDTILGRANDPTEECTSGYMNFMGLFFECKNGAWLEMSGASCENGPTDPNEIHSTPGGLCDDGRLILPE